MCNIIALEPKAQVPYEKLENCVFNNPHGFGLILRENDRIQVIKECSEKGNDPEKIARLLDENDDIERYLHLRWRTKGPIDMDNTHPFSVYNSNSRQVHFMHNGSLHPYGNDNESDTKEFAEKFLMPLLLRYEGEDGRGDIEDPFLRKIIEKFWSGGSKGLLVSNNQKPFLLGSWKEFKNGEEPGWKASNDTYFDKLVRGPEYEAQKKKEEAKRQPSFSQGQARFDDLETFGDRNYHRGFPTQGSGIANNSGIPSLTAIMRVSAIDPEIQDRMERYFDNPQLFTDEGMECFSWLTDIEMEELVDKHQPGEIAWLMIWLSERLSDLNNTCSVLEHKHQKATKKIAELQNEIKLLKEGTENE